VPLIVQFVAVIVWLQLPPWQRSTVQLFPSSGHAVPSAADASDGQAVLAPLHVSATSQPVPFAERHT
jgi:hypothetical protein